MKFFKIALLAATILPMGLLSIGCSSDTDTNQPKAQGPANPKLKGGPIGRGAPGGSGGTQGGGATPAGGLNKN